MNDIELIIKRFIRKEISAFKPRDKAYATEFLKNKLSELTKHLIKDEVIKSLYNKYRLGLDILEMLNNDAFYSNLPPEKFQILFKIEPLVEIPKSKKRSVKVNFKHKIEEPISLENIEMPSEVKLRKGKTTLIKENIPFVKKSLIRKAKRYIAIMELKAWVDKNGLTIIQIDEGKMASGEYDDDVNIDMIMVTIKNYLKDFIEGQKINDVNYHKLKNLLYNFFKDDSAPMLKEPILVKYGSAKKLAFALGEIYRELNDKPLSYNYLMLGKNNISIFKEHTVTKDRFQKTNLYKYYSTNPLK